MKKMDDWGVPELVRSRQQATVDRFSVPVIPPSPYAREALVMEEAYIFRSSPLRRAISPNRPVWRQLAERFRTPQGGWGFGSRGLPAKSPRMSCRQARRGSRCS